MKTKLKSTLIVAGAVLVATSLIAKSGSGSGQNSFHFSISQVFQNQGVETKASGTVKASQSIQGDANNQTMNIALKGLTPGANYSLLAGVGGDSNLTDVADFTTDSKGKATFNYVASGSTNGLGKNKSPLPDGLNPVTSVDELDVVDTNSDTVLTADLTTPKTLNVMIKQNISSNSVVATLTIKATQKKESFLLTASGLDQSVDYQLVINGTPVQTNTSDKNGKLKINSQQSGLSVLQIQTVELQDTLNNVILSTTLP